MDDEIDWMNVQIQWHGNDVLDDPELELKVRMDCANNLDGLSSVSSLIFHTIFLTKSYEHDIVSVWGDGETQILHAEYIPEPKWVTVSSEELDKTEKE